MKICPRCSEPHSDDKQYCSRDGAALRALVDPQIGKTIGGRHRLISRLASGGMSSVYLARHVMIERLMAIKTLRRDLAQDPVHRDRFLREARAVNRINHDNIVEITDFGETEDGLVYLVMEYVPGEPLVNTLTSAPLPAARALHIVEQVASALGRAHQMGVVHRDLKPDNILLVQREGEPDFVKILDFGIAKIQDAPSLTGSQQIFGTPGYIAPEYIQSSEIDGRADLYSLGMVLYEMVTGALPFDYEYPGDLLVKHVTEQPMAPSERHPGVEPAVEQFILQCLRKDPEERFRDAYHFRDELRRVRERIGAAELWGAMGERPSGAPAASAEPAPPAPSPSPQDEPPLRQTLPDGAAAEELDGSVESPRAPSETPSVRATTQDYIRPSIPGAPQAEEPAAAPVDIAVGDDEAAQQVSEPAPGSAPPPPVRQGLLGVIRWRERFDAIREALDELEQQHAVPEEVAHAMTFAQRTLERLEQGVARCEEHQRKIEELSTDVRDVRSTLGRAIDDRGRELSQQRRAFEQFVARRNELRSEREAAMSKLRGGGSEGRADAILWELAAVEQELQERAGRCDDLEAQLADLRAELEHRDEQLEQERARLVRHVDEEMVELESLAAALREPLERGEQYVRACWGDEDGEADPEAGPEPAEWDSR